MEKLNFIIKWLKLKLIENRESNADLDLDIEIIPTGDYEGR